MEVNNVYSISNTVSELIGYRKEARLFLSLGLFLFGDDVNFTKAMSRINLLIVNRNGVGVVVGDDLEPGIANA